MLLETVCLFKEFHFPRTFRNCNCFVIAIWITSERTEIFSHILGECETIRMPILCWMVYRVSRFKLHLINMQWSDDLQTKTVAYRNGRCGYFSISLTTSYASWHFSVKNFVTLLNLTLNVMVAILLIIKFITFSIFVRYCMV